MSLHFRSTKLFFFSPLFTRRFLDDEPVITLDLENNKGISSSELITALSQMYSLFTSQTEIIIDSKNVQTFRLLAIKIDNRFLRLACSNVNDKKSQQFSLSFDHLITIDTNILESLATFSLISPSETFLVNPALFCCISDFFFQSFFY